MHPMRTTVDLPPAVHRQVRQLAAEQGRSLSAVIADLTLRGLAQRRAPAEVRTDARSGFPVLSLGRSVTAADVAAALDE